MKSEALCLEANHVSFSYDGAPVLEDINFTIKQGEYVGLIGPNGGGKTTLVKLLLGILKPTSGEIKVFGTPIDRLREKYRIGYVPQRVSQGDAQFPTTVEEVVWAGLTAMKGVFSTRTKADMKKVTQAMQVAGITQLAHRRLGALSGGQRQRVFIAQALVSQPKILILDEPTAGVDMPSQESFYSFIGTMNKELGLTIVLVSHDIEMVAEDVTSVLCLNRSLIAHGTPKEVLDDENLDHLYGNKLIHVHHHH